MGKLMVTGATGHLGRAALHQLLRSQPAERLVGLARDPSRAADLAERGIEVRRGDYFDHGSLVRAFAGVERLLLVSAVALSDRNAQHFNAIAAAKQAGVEHVVFTAVQRDEGSDVRQPGVTDSDVFAEQALQASGLTWTVLRQPIFLDVLGTNLGADPYRNGVRVPDGAGAVAPALRRDLAAASAAVLTEDGHENTTYTLSGSESGSFREIAAALSEVHGAPVPHVPVAPEDYVDGLIAELGVPRSLAEFMAEWTAAINRGEFGASTGDLERLIGYRPTGYREFFARHYPLVVPDAEQAVVD
ncbi:MULTISPECIES: SDR family oxidoreductase [unclassified Saccharopolyspora]|uniref:SDR family oxidoreductase n=1 Tax=unclassified Saccharopolyspora TaxID=2646250 RepID=UPI001CD37779|nr:MULTISPECIES: SDR family oxidoreductase [unclassified Saccharopolyspora]MCA1189248.1 SDR family oxidoreductase [Saccharopolyspora sp. 6T]MCA1280627.1 SDR family oxidoreductase [Saccharopolyspora sp. 7B]